METCLTSNYIKITEKLKSPNFSPQKIKLKSKNLNNNGNNNYNDIIDCDIIECFCEALQNNTTFKGKLDLSYNNLNELHLFNILSTVYENENISGINIKHNKITKLVLNKLLLIINNKANIKYLNIQNTYLNNQEIKNIIYSSLSHNYIETLKLPYLHIEVFPFFIKHLNENNFINKLHILITSRDFINSNNSIFHDNAKETYENCIQKLRKLFKELYNVVENKENIKNVKFEIDFHDQEIEDLIDCIKYTCEKHKESLKKEQKNNEDAIEISSFEKIQLLMSDIKGTKKHIKKFEKEVPLHFNKDIVNLIQKMLP
ncbi:conserved protein, unknown function [Hepatocystis sp. ex Piliocolobus tephrosceles]|nr:conserved protein, unknown function [Hepatocystis sp. ex Piliocolobus tephrosceles]